MELRAREEVYLIKNVEFSITGVKLPSNQQVLQVLFFNMRSVKLSLRESANLVIKETEIYWNKSRIPIRETHKSVNKLEKLYEEYRALQKNRHSKNPVCKNKEKSFCENLSNLFDISRVNALQLMSNEKDKMFFLNQQKKRKSWSNWKCC